MKIKLSLLATGLLYVPVVFAQKQPNVVIILADDMGYGDVGCNNPSINWPGTVSVLRMPILRVR